MIHNASLLLELAWRFAVLSLVSVGGGISSLIPQFRTEFVTQTHLLTDRDFAELLAIAQASPGPNFLFVPLIGWRLAGVIGALVCVVAYLIMPLLITYFAGRALHQHENAWLVLARRAFRPVTAGTWIAAGLVVALVTDRSLPPLAITAGVFGLSLFVDASPIWWCVAAGILGAIFG